MDSSFEKILNLMDNAGTPGEAEAAAAAFRRKLLKENLTEEEVRSQLTAHQARDVGAVVFTATPGSWYQAQWHLLMSVVADNNLCSWYRIGSSGPLGVLVGTEKNRNYVFDVYFRLHTQFSEMLKVERRRARDKSGFGQSFLVGVIEGLKFRYFLESSEDSKSETALVLTTHEENQAYVQEMFGQTNSSRRTMSPENLSAYAAGYTTGMSSSDSERLEN